MRWEKWKSGKVLFLKRFWKSGKVEAKVRRSQKSSVLMLCCSVVSDSLQPHGLQHPHASLSFIIYQSLLKFIH